MLRILVARHRFRKGDPLSRLNDLLRELGDRDPVFAKDLEREVAALADRRAFGLNFERHVPEAVELPGRKVRKGDKVRKLPPRGQMPTRPDEKLWRVASIDRVSRMATLTPLFAKEPALVDQDAARAPEGGGPISVAIGDLVVVAEFRDPIYPGLISTGRLTKGGDKPFHAVINAENFHALETLLFTHRGSVDCIYIDPPYNSGARDWKYNNDYVASDDLYRHSKWLAFMERRLLVARELLNPDDSVLIVTIDEKEYLRLGLLLEQVFESARIQMVSSVISQKGVHRDIGMNRVDEYIFFVFNGRAKLAPMSPAFTGHSRAAKRTQVWYPLIRTGSNSTPSHSPGCHFPIFLDADGKVLGAGQPIPPGESVELSPGATHVVLPIKKDGTPGVWQLGREMFEATASRGYITGKFDSDGRPYLMYIRAGMIDRIESGDIESSGKDARGVLQVSAFEGDQPQGARTQWNNVAHDATLHGTNLNKALLKDRKFPYPKSLYAVEDALRFYLATKPEAVVLDYFAGSGTTAHAVMRLNRQDGGRRRSVSVTNNEVGPDEQEALRASQLRPGDPEWEKWGICEYITKPRIEAAISGICPDGEPIKGDYKFTDEFPMADGFEENVEFFTLTYEAPLRVASHREFARVAPLLWLRAGARGRRIDDVSRGWDVADTYAVLADLDHAEPFLKAIEDNIDVAIAYIVTDEERLFESVAQHLRGGIEPVRLYEAYLRNFEIESGRGLL